MYLSLKKLLLSQRELKDLDLDTSLCCEGRERTDFLYMILEKVLDFMRSSSDIKEVRGFMALVVFITPFSFECSENRLTRIDSFH